jgi:hypothetical protein
MHAPIVLKIDGILLELFLLILDFVVANHTTEVGWDEDAFLKFHKFVKK